MTQIKKEVAAIKKIISGFLGWRSKINNKVTSFFKGPAETQPKTKKANRPKKKRTRRDR